jgi:colanic acid/amylovoran biosynthesis glycosyltransferase
MKIAYLVNQYPKVSHSFIRREILGIEACGIPVERFSIRSCEAELVDPLDKAELEKTRIVLGVGAAALIFHLFLVAIAQPVRWLNALKITLKIGRHSDRGILRHIVYLAEACILLRWFSQSGISHVHAHFGTNPTTVAMLCQLLGGPSYSFTVHGPEEFDCVKSLALTEKINRAAFVVAISSFGKSQLYRWCSYDQWSKIQVVRCGVDSSFLNYPPTVPPNYSRLVCVGRLCEQKGQLLLIEAAKRLAIAGIEFELILVGDGPLRSEIENLVEQYNLQKHVKITGWASGDEVLEQIIGSQAMVLPSFAEGLPVVLMEALALGRPVISTYVAGIPELVEPGINGWLVPAGSVEALAMVMASVLQLPLEQLEQMGRAGAAKVAQQQNADLEAKKLAELFQQNTQLTFS